MKKELLKVTEQTITDLLHFLKDEERGAVMTKVIKSTKGLEGIARVI